MEKVESGGAAIAIMSTILNLSWIRHQSRERDFQHDNLG